VEHYDFGRHAYVVLTTPEWWSALLPGPPVSPRDASELTLRLDAELPDAIEARCAPPDGVAEYYEQRGQQLYWLLDADTDHQRVRHMVRTHASAILVAHRALREAREG